MDRGKIPIKVFAFRKVQVSNWFAQGTRAHNLRHRDTIQLCHVTLSSVFVVHPRHAYPGKLRECIDIVLIPFTDLS